jgi:hypothetical protein
MVAVLGIPLAAVVAGIGHSGSDVQLGALTAPPLESQAQIWDTCWDVAKMAQGVLTIHSQHFS